MRQVIDAAVNVIQGRMAIWVVLTLSVLASVAGWYISGKYVNEQAEVRFADETRELTTRINNRMAVYKQVLRGARGLFRASSHVTRKEWRQYVSGLRLHEQFPGFLGIGYARHIRPSELTSHVNKIRAEGFPGYQVKPAGVREEYTSIVYLEPFDETNRRAFGYDMFSEPVRRAAMERARDTGMAALSGRVDLVQNASTEKLSAFLIYLPIYSTSEMPATVEQRRQSLSGYVYSPFFVNRVMNGILQNQQVNASFRIFDNATEETDALLYDGVTELKIGTSDHEPEFTSTSIIETSGRKWLLRFDSTPAFESDLDFRLPNSILLGGLVLGGLLFIVALTLTTTRQRALQIAEGMTEKARKSQSRLENLFEFAPDATVMVNEKGIIVMVNRQAEKLFRWSRNDLVGQSIEVLIPSEIRDHHMDLRQGFLESAAPRVMGDGQKNLRGLRKDGTTVPIEVSLSPIASGDETKVVAAMRDISERMQSEQAMRKATLMLDATTDMAFVFDPDSLRFNYVNEGAALHLGYTREQLLTMTPLDIGLGFTEASFRELLAPMLSGGLLNHQIITTIRCEDGHDIAAEINLQYMALEEGEYCFIAIGRDVTERQRSIVALKKAANDLKLANKAVKRERKRLAERVDKRTAELRMSNEQLEHARKEAEHANRAKSAFLAAMSHEIRTPMNGVVGMIEVLSHSKLTDNQADAVKTIRESAFSLLSLIDEILDFSKIEAGKLELERAEVSVPDIAEAVCNTLAPVAASKGVDLSVFIDPRVPDKIWTDSTRLRQVLYNLIGNAIKFSGGSANQRGRVSVRVDVADAEPSRLIFTVTDNGIGMTDETLSKLFTSFSQAEASTTRRFGGTGLGLAITSRLVELMRGSIAVESNPDAGSCFSVTLPVEVVEGSEHRVLRDLSGLECILVSNVNGDMNDMNVYLQYAGANTCIVNSLADAERVASEVSNPIVIYTAGQKKVKDSIAELHATFADVTDVHHILITRGKRQYARMEAPDTLVIDADSLRMASLLRAVAVAGGRASVEIFHKESEDGLLESENAAPTVAEARAAGQLILVAEDDAINQKVILRQLALLGYAAEVAGNGQEALKLWREGTYALLLTDLHMPELDGYGLTEAIRREQSGQHIPILALTANALRGETHHAMAAGMNEYLIKPIQLQMLAAALEKWMPVPATDEFVKLPAVNVDAATSKNIPVDLNLLKNLVGDDQGVLRALLGDYLIALRQIASELREAFDAGDAKHVGFSAHKLKSSSRSMGALVFGDLCAELENAVRAEDPKSIASHMTGFDEALKDVDSAINSMLNEVII